MWKNLRAGRTFDVILVVAASARQRGHLRRHFEQEGGWNTVFHGAPVAFASLDELGRPWRGGNFDASLFAVQRIRRLLSQRGVPAETGKSLAVLVAGHGTRAYPLTVAEGGDKSMIRTPAQLGQRGLSMVELVVAQYHQILDDVEPGRIHVAAGDHILGWSRPPRSAGEQHVQIMTHKISFAAEAEAAGLLDGNGHPRWSGGGELRRRLAGMDVAGRLPVLHALTRLGVLKASTQGEHLLRLVEKPDVATTLADLGEPGGEARVNWWDWSLSPEASSLLVREYADLMGKGIDLSMDVLEPVAMGREEWRRHRPLRDPGLWDRANEIFVNTAVPGAMPGGGPLGTIGVADSGNGSIFADLGTLRSLYEAYSTCLQRTEEGRRYRALFGARLQDGSLFAGERPHHRVEVEPGCIVIESAGVRSGRISAGSIAVETMAGELRTRGRCIVYGVRAPGRRVDVRDGEVAAGVVHFGRRHTVRTSLFGALKGEDDRLAWDRPCHGNPMSFSDLHAELMMRDANPAPPGREGRDASLRQPSRDRASWRRRTETPSGAP
jgi:hypothetical protein